MTNLVKMDIIKRSQSHETRYTNWYNTNNEPTVQFIRHRAMETNDNNRPPQWGNNSPSPPKSPSHPLLSRSPSSDSRARAIAQGQWELMEMVRNMPESSYELSLKDLVENQDTIDGLEQKIDQDLNQKGVVKSKRSKEESKKIVSNNNKGLFLNVGFRFSLESRMKKKNDNKVGRNFSNNKVSPKVDVTGEKDWWKKRFSGSRDSNGSGVSSSSSGGGGGSTSTTVSSGSGDGGRKRNGSPTGCWPFFCGGRKSDE